MRDENMDRGNNAWNKDSSNKGNQNKNANKQNSGNKGVNNTGRNDFSSRSGDARIDLNKDHHRSEARNEHGHGERKDLNQGQYDRSQNRQDQRNTQKNPNQNTGRNNKDIHKNIDQDKRKAG